jgi:hypothetical protein
VERERKGRRRDEGSQSRGRKKGLKRGKLVASTIK